MRQVRKWSCQAPVAVFAPRMATRALSASSGFLMPISARRSSTGCELALVAQHGGVELGDGAAGVGQLCPLAAGRGDEEVDDRHVEEDREQVQLVGVEAAPALAVETSLHGRDRRLGERVAGELGEAVGHLLLGPALALPDGLQVVGHHRVHVEAVAALGLARFLCRWRLLAGPHKVPLIAGCVSSQQYHIPRLTCGASYGAQQQHMMSPRNSLTPPRPDHLSATVLGHSGSLSALRRSALATPWSTTPGTAFHLPALCPPRPDPPATASLPHTTRPVPATAPQSSNPGFSLLSSDHISSGSRLAQFPPPLASPYPAQPLSLERPSPNFHPAFPRSSDHFSS